MSIKSIEIPYMRPTNDIALNEVIAASSLINNATGLYPVTLHNETYDIEVRYKSYIGTELIIDAGTHIFHVDSLKIFDDDDKEYAIASSNYSTRGRYLFLKSKNARGIHNLRVEIKGTFGYGGTSIAYTLGGDISASTTEVPVATIPDSAAGDVIAMSNLITNDHEVIVVVGNDGTNLTLYRNALRQPFESADVTYDSGDPYLRIYAPKQIAYACEYIAKRLDLRTDSPDTPLDIMQGISPLLGAFKA